MMRCFFALVAGMCLALCAADPLPEPSATAPKQSPLEKRLQNGRSLFQKKQYADALVEFKAALALQPEHRDARFFCGLAAYWSRQPELALAYWNAALDKARRNSDEEWELQRHRVLALSALSQEAADTCVARLYELHSEGKSKAVQNARGFAREHLIDGKIRGVVWEIFDERGESEDVWTCPVVNEDKDDEALKIFSVKAALMPGGTSGFALIEEGPGYIRTYQRWAKKPDYAAVRPTLLAAFQGKSKALDEKQADNAARFGRAETDAPEKPETIQPAVKSMQMSPEASRIVNIAARLREINFDITRMTRLSVSDPDLAERMLRELKARAPLAQEDAAEFVDLLTRTKPQHAQEAFAGIIRLGERKPYFDFVLLTAINTRAGNDAPAEILEALTGSKDFMVRQTALLMAARQGKADALAGLVKEVENADSIGANIVSASLQELVAELPAAPPPGADEASLKKWRTAISEWFTADEKALKFNSKPKPGEPYWTK